jgi:hypothetical protein
LRPGDAYLHADVFGAPSCILRAKRRRHCTPAISGGGTTATTTTTTTTTTTVVIPLSEGALREAGNFAICRSSAWSSRTVTSAWWVESHQVSKTAPTGEYLTVGSFMIRGKKRFLPVSQLEMGLGVMFRLGDYRCCEICRRFHEFSPVLKELIKLTATLLDRDLELITRLLHIFIRCKLQSGA